MGVSKESSNGASLSFPGGKSVRHQWDQSCEIERLTLVSEEVGKVFLTIGKKLRHGYESTHSNGGLTNREQLELESGDLLASMKIMARSCDLYFQRLINLKEIGSGKYRKYFHR